MYGEKQEAMAFIQPVRLSCPITAARWMVAVPCCSPKALVLLATGPPSDTTLSLLSLGCQMKDYKLQFLESICILCRSATEYGSLLGLEFCCQRYELAKKIEVRVHLVLWGRGQGTPAPSEGSACTGQGAGGMGGGHPFVPFPGLDHVQHHRLLCLQDIACPWISQAVQASCPGNSDQSPGWEGQHNPCHCSLSSQQTLDAMDTMLKAVVLNSPGEVLQDTLEVWPVQRVGVLGLFLTLAVCPIWGGWSPAHF